MKDIRPTLLALLSALLVFGGLLAAGCGDDDPGAEEARDTGARVLDASGTDVADAAVDLDESDEGDAEPGDASDDSSEDDASDDAGDSEDEEDGEDDATVDTGSDIPAPDDTYEVIEPTEEGIDCSEDAELCVDEWACIQDVCTLDPGGRVFVEQSYQFREPEELEHVFDFIKTFAADVAFFMLDISDEGDPWRRPARYGSADRIVLPETLNVVYAWQYPEEDRLILEPYRGETGLLGDTWLSNEFQWNLRAKIVLEDLRVDEEIAFVAETAQVMVTFRDDFSLGHGEFRGVVTRREAESRVLASSAFEPFRLLICEVHPNLVPPGENWTLADILDCNAAPMDVDLNGDGILDGYNAVVDFIVEPAVIQGSEPL